MGKCELHIYIFPSFQKVCEFGFALNPKPYPMNGYFYERVFQYPHKCIASFDGQKSCIAYWNGKKTIFFLST